MAENPSGVFVLKSQREHGDGERTGKWLYRGGKNGGGKLGGAVSCNANHVWCKHMFCSQHLAVNTAHDTGSNHVGEKLLT